MYLFSLNLNYPSCFSSRDSPGVWSLRLAFMYAAVFLFFSCPAIGHSVIKENNVISDVHSVYDDGVLQVTMKGSIVPIYTVYELFKPARVVIDVARSELDGGISLTMPAESGVTLSSKKINDAEPFLTRFVFTLNESRPFSVLEKDNKLLISINDLDRGKSGVDVLPATDQPRVPEITDIMVADSPQRTIAGQLPEIDPLQAAGQAGIIDATGAVEDDFGFGGFNRERITVDFYKIDLHNVFRLLREVSGHNIVVDESVAGSLTLALNDVPWDFALDIIINLKGLQKEERFNTIVILPGNKEFFWPERAGDNLAFEADLEVVAREALLIQQHENISPVIVETRELINKGRKLESQGKLEGAVKIYSEALRKWPDNASLAAQISSLYLVQLRQNARALFFARKALAADPKSDAGLLNAAIASFNMEDFTLARQYFDRAVMSRNPSKEALLNYAVFSEEQHGYEQALKLLQKHNSLHGEDLNSMLAQARILDKQGKEEEATVAYRRILLSGYRITPDLRKFIKNRIALRQSM